MPNTSSSDGAADGFTSVSTPAISTGSLDDDAVFLSFFGWSSEISMSMSLVAGPEDGGVVDELRLGVRSGTDDNELADVRADASDTVLSTTDGDVEREPPAGAESTEDVEGASATTRAARNAASGGRGGKMISAGSICWGWAIQLS